MFHQQEFSAPAGALGAASFNPFDKKLDQGFSAFKPSMGGNQTEFRPQTTQGQFAFAPAQSSRFAQGSQFAQPNTFQASGYAPSNPQMANQLAYGLADMPQCRSYEEFGFCQNQRSCQFAHGFELPRPTKYKTQDCKMFHKQFFCAYGINCHFRHESRSFKKVHRHYYMCHVQALPIISEEIFVESQNMPDGCDDLELNFKSEMGQSKDCPSSEMRQLKELVQSNGQRPRLPIFTAVAIEECPVNKAESCSSSFEEPSTGSDCSFGPTNDSQDASPSKDEFDLNISNLLDQSFETCA